MRRIVCILSLLLLNCGCTDAQSTKVALRELNAPEVGTRHLLNPAGLITGETQQTTGAKYAAFGLDIEVRQQGDSMIYRLTDTANRQILRVACVRDSVEEWGRSGHEAYERHAVKFRAGERSYFLIPGTAATYDEPAYNRFPAMLSDGCIASGKFGRAEIFTATDYAGKSIIRVREDGSFHTDAVREGLQYRFSYAVSDTIPIAGKPYTVAKFNRSDITFTPVKQQPSKRLNAQAFKHFADMFDGRDYLFVDFWGTWCGPCLESMPQIKALHEQYGDRITFLSVCYDNERNYDKARQILKRHGIDWHDIFVPQSERYSVVRLLDVTNFPSYLIIDRQGSVLLFEYGTYNLPKVRAAFDAIP